MEADRQQARAAGSDEARVSRCVRYRRTPSPESGRQEGGRRGGRDSDGLGFLRDRARDGDQRDRAGGGGGRGERADRTRSQLQQKQQQQRQQREEEAWRAERKQIDERRVERSKARDGGWRREWDREKQPVNDRRWVQLH